MALNYSELVEQYGDGSSIPNDILYTLLLEQKQDLINHSSIEDIREWKLGKEVRRRCKTDLMWMAQYFTWESNPISENGTKPFSNNIFGEEFYGPFPNFFIKKDESKPIEEQSDIKTRLLLWSRGGAKSTFDHVDTAQWILNFPAIRVLYLTAERSLSEGFVGEIKGHFYFKEEPSFMNLFFPEFCIEEGKSGAKNTFTCPVYAAKKTGRKEPTVYASSVGKSKAGWRYELIKADDAVSDVNSLTSEQCTKVSGYLFLAEKLLALGGFYIDYVGTRYNEADHYGVLLEQNKDSELMSSGQGWELRENKTTTTRILIGRAIQIKPEVKDKLEREGRPVNYIEAGEDGCVLLLPTKMPYAWCIGDFTKNEKIFEEQRNQNTRIQSQIAFDRMMMLRATVPYTMLPRSGPCSVFWDLATSQKKGRDFTVGSSIMWAEQDQISPDGKRTGNKMTVGYVRKIVRDRIPPHLQAQAIVQLAVEERPFVVAIEKAQGAEYLKESIESCAIRTGDSYIIELCTHIDWVTPDQQDQAKLQRMAALHPWISEGRLKFANFCLNDKYGKPDLNPLYDEFERCLTDHHHDDIPDNLGYQVRYAPRATQAIVENNQSMFSRYDLGWNEIFEEGWTDSRGMRLTTDENGNTITWDPTQTFIIQDEFNMEQEEQPYSYFGGR